MLKDFIGSNNFSKIVGAKNTINNIRQLKAMVHQRDIDDIDAILETALRGGLIDNALEHDVRVRDDYGQTRWLRWSAEQKVDSNNEVVCYGAVRDITLERRSERHEKTLLALSERRYKQLQKMSTQLNERVQSMEMLSNALREAREVAVRANKSKSRFLAMMSHDIRTPMNAILATLELLGLSSLDETQKRQLKLAQNSGDQLLFLLADIIEYARSDGWLLDIDAQPITIVDFIQNTADTWKQLADKKDLEIQTDIEKDNPKYIALDHTRVRQLLDNLISNAIKYTDSGTITINSKIIESDTISKLKISVKDTGNGISASVQKMLFHDLERGEHQDDYDIQGSGLGLSICRRIVDAMNGEIGVDSKLNKGSIFWFEIPIKIISEGDYVTANNVVKPIDILVVDGRRPKLLVAEDVAANQMVVTSMLEKFGCDYELAMDGKQAVELAEQQEFDMILMDVSMPQLNGMEATKLIRAKHNDVPILAVTAFAADDEREAIMASGMDGLISKPINLSALHQKLKAIFGHEDKNDLNLYVNAEANTSGPDGIDFEVGDYIDFDKLRCQILSVPNDKKKQLLQAIVDDLRDWFRRFQMAWQGSDQEEISTSFHALTGICNGFGAHKLLQSIEVIRDSGDIGNSNELAVVMEIYEHTILSFQNAESSIESK